MRRRLTKEEREIRSGRNIGFGRWWPFAFIFVVLVIIASTDFALFERCIGNPMDGNGRGWAVLRLLATIPCSPFLLRGGTVEWLAFAALWLPVPIAIRNYRWYRRHSLYWDKVRLREAERRAEKRSRRNQADK